ncbi:Mediator of RNA polymerase II transcription subunit 14 [Trametes pubescens]|uniref:Mediator of RNA polymerase II transcription subunit 14 n=1 Tax=Trametes pubescens TaxID=154538 RepID=A0A1M2VYY2_TRAPU|nr:Mediator of RNA polymerase II transcription subunit 14 [Trametes pubescens]
MEQAVNGLVMNGTTSHLPLPLQNGDLVLHEPSPEELERELPVVTDGQVPLGELTSRLVQAMYAELTEFAETMPTMSDAARKRSLADWVVKFKRQVVKLYAIAKWSRDASVVQKAMNITAFLMDQNGQFEEAIMGLKYGKESLDPARLRNHDLLTSLDVLTTGTYRRLPSCIKELIIPPVPLTDEEVAKTLADIEDAMRYRLRTSEIVPWELSQYRIADGRVWFTAPKLFEASLCLQGAGKTDGWFFVNVTFLFKVGGDLTGMQDFPRTPTGVLKRNITDEADARLAFYLPPEAPPPPGVEAPPRPELPEGVVDAPLVRVFNFLQMMSLSYQLEILWYQAEHMRSLGWADYLKVEMTNNRQKMVVSYWLWKPLPGQQASSQARNRAPQLGGKLSISITRVKEKTGRQAMRSPKARVLAELQERSKLERARPSDEVEHLRFDVQWEPAQGTLGVNIGPEDAYIPPEQLAIDPNDLDFEGLLRRVIRRHTEGIMKYFQRDLMQNAHTRNVFSAPGEVTFVTNEGTPSLRVHLCADEVVIVTVDPRTGRLTLCDTGDLAAAGRGPRFAAISDRLNDSPQRLPEALIRLRLSTITDLAEQKVQYVGLQSFRERNFLPEEIAKLGPDARGKLYIQLANFTSHYLVLVITDNDYRYALINVKVQRDTMYNNLIMEDIGWLDIHRLHTGDMVVEPGHGPEPVVGQKRKRDDRDEVPVVPAAPAEQNPTSFRLETKVLRELYAYCCARVAYTKVEQQFKLRQIPYTHVNSTASIGALDAAHIQSSLARSIPALCVLSRDILSGAPAEEAAMPNIRVIPLNWWSNDQAKVVTCVKLKYVQQPIGKRASGTSVIRPSKRIVYDTREAIVSFLSDDVDKCVDEFLEEWARVSKMVVIAREVAQMSTKHLWTDVRLLSFDLQTVEFAYAADYTLSLTCTDQLTSTGGSYHLRFGRVEHDDEMEVDGEPLRTTHNPHEDVEPYMRNLLRHGPLTSTLHRLVSLLRETLPIVAELEEIRAAAARSGVVVDTFAKSAGWFRILYGDLRHALDFRLMAGARVVILDGSHSLFDDSADGHTLRRLSGPSKAFASRDREPTAALQPIPDFRALVQDAIKGAVARGVAGQFAPIDIGVICDVSAVRVVGRLLYERVLEKLAAQAGPHL